VVTLQVARERETRERATDAPDERLGAVGQTVLGGAWCGFGPTLNPRFR
jgi:hypothetical protein